MRLSLLAATVFALVFASATLQAREANEALTVPPSGVLGVGEAQLAPAFWIGLQADPDRVILDRAAIEAQNARLLQVDPSMHDLRALPKTLSREQVAGWIEKLSERPDRPLFDVDGQPVPTATLDAVVGNLALDAIPAQQNTRYGLVVRRAALRTFPTALRVFSTKGDTDIDRFQETAEFPGTPVAIVHTSADGKWLFVISPRYAAWTEKENVAEGSAGEVFGYAGRTPYRVITGAVERTVFTREQPAVSQLPLDMGTRVPLVTDLPPDQPVNGQTPYAAHVIELPLRKADGSLGFSPALLQKNTDTAADYLPLTRANIIRQAFKFLGERYGWGHAYDGRDCSGFVSDVYRSMGVEMPRNTSRQAVSPALEHRVFTAKDSREARIKAAQALEVGDLVYIPGHVMMVIGRLHGQPYVIHDVGGMSYRKADGGKARIKLNAVSVTPLLPLLYNDKQSYVERMTSIVRIRR
ncbi:NlpC-P60 family protein [Rhodanobacter denitrificans]|uniref:NlpC-P60 family protein n=1 Tax=Rhodanobacter denitrificans TaxID=666685 RepID=A0A368KCY6_9GAMM|nr:SH3 domain-containing protein [Rhodanobacter denitrificans]RCS29687.1 NlpC-P60 family protein [Rhodanobacter denitrificans]